MNLILLFGGSGTRMQNITPKQFLKVNNKTVMEHTLNAFKDFFDEFNQVIIVTNKNSITLTNEILANYDYTFSVVEGGKEREDSIKNAFAVIEKPQFTLVHDGARCNISPTIINACIASAKSNTTFTVAIPSIDTLCVTPDGVKTLNTIDRNVVYAVQTPQGFLQEEYEMLFEAKTKTNTTDLVDLYSQFERPVKIIKGSKLNFKVTTPEDLVMFEALSKGNKNEI